MAKLNFLALVLLLASVNGSPTHSELMSKEKEIDNTKYVPNNVRAAGQVCMLNIPCNDAQNVGTKQGNQGAGGSGGAGGGSPLTQCTQLFGVLQQLFQTVSSTTSNFGSITNIGGAGSLFPFGGSSSRQGIFNLIPGASQLLPTCQLLNDCSQMLTIPGINS